MAHDHKLASKVMQRSLHCCSFKFVLLPHDLTAEFSLQKVSLEFKMGWHLCFWRNFLL